MIEIESLEGRELDAAVAREVMHKNPNYVRWCSPRSSGYYLIAPPHYSTDIAHAWEVVGKVEAELDCRFTLAHTPGWESWAASFHGCASDGEKDYGVGDTKGKAYAETAPLAICRAALRAGRAK